MFAVIRLSSGFRHQIIGHREEPRTRAPAEQTRPSVGMDELGVAAPGAGESKARAEIDPANRGQIGLRHVVPP
jgi:hypothetical protein